MINRWRVQVACGVLMLGSKMTRSAVVTVSFPGCRWWVVVEGGGGGGVGIR